MDRYRAILNTVDGEVVADMVKGVCAGYYLADDADTRIKKLVAELVQRNKRIEELETALELSDKIGDGFSIAMIEAEAQLETAEKQLEQVREFSTSHIHLEDEQVFIKVRRDKFLKAIIKEG